MELKSDCASESFSPAGILFLRRGCLLKDYEYLDGILILPGVHEFTLAGLWTELKYPNTKMGELKANERTEKLPEPNQLAVARC